MKAALPGIFTLAICGLAALISACSHPVTASESTVSGSWDPKTAASYLDQREKWWAEWPGAARDHGTFCVSCHTAVPYALARPALHSALAEQDLSPSEHQLLDNVAKRVRMWKSTAPSYTDNSFKVDESRGSEAVINALILAGYDSRTGKLSGDTRAAFDNMWALQRKEGEKKGSWFWLQFDLQPWEANDSQYYGATLAAVAVGLAPENYRASPNIQNNLKLLREYLDRDYPTQSTIHRMDLLWASTKLPGLLTSEQRESIIKEVFGKQRADGGWRLATVVWTWRSWSFSTLASNWIATSVKQDGTPLEVTSDGYATGFITFALQEAGVPREDVHLQRALSWLRNHQNRTAGLWASDSLNKRRAASSDIHLFMSDAATAYAVLALTENDQH